MPRQAKPDAIGPDLVGRTPFEHQLPAEPSESSCETVRATKAVGTWRTQVGTVARMPVLPAWMTQVGKE